MQRRSTFAGGFPIAAGVLVGVAVGLARGQATLGFLAGLAAGAVLALAIWLLDRR